MTPVPAGSVRCEGVHLGSRLRGQFAIWLLLLCLGALIAGCQAAAPTPNLALAGYSRPTPKPTKTMELVVQEATDLAAISPSFLASEHLARGARCQSCHTAYPPRSVPLAAACLACHGDDETKLTALVKSPTTQWHELHIGVIACGDCHYGHEKFESKCVWCHPGCTVH